jgi:hypothetical protein
MKKAPKVTNPARPSNQYALPGERIIEFSDEVAAVGELISFQRIDGNDGRATLSVCLYRLDADVQIIVEHGHPNLHCEGYTKDGTK